MKTIKLFLLIAVLSISTVVLGQPYYQDGVHISFRDKTTQEMITYTVTEKDPTMHPRILIQNVNNRDDFTLLYTDGTKVPISVNREIGFRSDNWYSVNEALYRAFGRELAYQIRHLKIGISCVSDENGNIIEVSFRFDKKEQALMSIHPQKFYDAERLIKKNLKLDLSSENERYHNPNVYDLYALNEYPEFVDTQTLTDNYNNVYVKNRYQYCNVDIVSIKRQNSEFANTTPTYTNKTPIPTELVQNATIGYVFIKECMPAELLARLKAANKEMTINFAISQLGYLMDLEFVFDNDALMAEIPMSVFADIYLRTEFKTLSAPVLGLQSNISYTTGSKVIKFKDIN